MQRYPVGRPVGLQAALVALLGYEIAAIVTRRMPTITRIAGRRRWLRPVLVLSLAAELWWDTLKKQGRDE